MTREQKAEIDRRYKQSPRGQQRRREQRAARRASDAGYNALLKEQSIRHRINNPEKRKARQAVNNAIRDGRLTRLPCRVCGKTAQAHHEDYSKPLDVDWLCFHHHRTTAHGQRTIANC